MFGRAAPLRHPGRPTSCDFPPRGPTCSLEFLEISIQELEAHVTIRLPQGSVRGPEAGLAPVSAFYYCCVCACAGVSPTPHPCSMGCPVKSPGKGGNTSVSRETSEKPRDSSLEGVGQPNTQRSKTVGFLSAEGQQVPLWGFRDPCQLKAPPFLQATYPVILPPGPLEPRFQKNHVVPNTWGEHG